MIDYIYVHLHIDISTSFKGILLKRIKPADLPTLETAEPAVLECVLMETPLYLLYYHSNLDSWSSVWTREKKKTAQTPPPPTTQPHPSLKGRSSPSADLRTTQAHVLLPQDPASSWEHFNPRGPDTRGSGGGGGGGGSGGGRKGDLEKK